MTVRMGPIRQALACLLLLAASLASRAEGAHAPGPAPSVEAFFGPAAMSSAALSPSGKHIAALVSVDGSRRSILVIDTADPRKTSFAATFTNSDIGRVEWVNDDRLVFSAGTENETAWRTQYSALFAVDRTGANLRTLIASSYSSRNLSEGASLIKSRILRPDHFFMRTLRDGSDDVVVGKSTFGVDGTVAGTYPLRLDTRSSAIKRVIAGTTPDGANDWALDEHGKPLAVITSGGASTRVLVPDGEGWRKIAEFDRYGVSAGAISLLDVGADDAVYVTAPTGSAAQTSGLFRLDLASGKLSSKPVVAVEGFDFQGSLVSNLARHSLSGVHYVGDAGGTAWFDPALAKVQAEVDAKLPGLVNTLAPAECGCSTKVVVTSASDRQPTTFFIYDTDTKTLARIGASRPGIQAAAMADTDFVRFKARDGLEIPAWVTKPAGKGPFPTVVLVHGGPWVRGRQWRFSAEPQFLASRGYAVIEPEFRGSTGYGSVLMEAGFRQWGMKMDDDLVDAARWAAASGWSDPKHVCVMGGSYGGYATLMALIKDPGTFRCGIALAAVTDIDLMYSIDWSDFGNDWKSYGMPRMVGDRVKDAAQLAQTSPIRRAAELKQPLLLAHGGVDERVPVEHAEQLVSALRDSGKTNLEWVRYDEEAHGLYKPENRYDFYTRVEEFLDAQIGGGARAATTPYSHAAGRMPSVQSFFGPVAMRSVVLSPSGKHLAALVAADGGRRSLVVMDTAATRNTSVAASFTNSDIEHVEWVNDNRLVFSAGTENETAGPSAGSALFAVDRTGAALRPLIDASRGVAQESLPIGSHVLASDHALMRTLRDGSDDVVVGRATPSTEGTALPLRLDTRTSAIKNVAAGTPPEFARDWALDDHGKPLAVFTAGQATAGVLVPAGDGWRKVAEFDRRGVGAGAMSLVDVGADGAVYVSASGGSAAGASSLFRLDLNNGSVGSEPVVSLEGFDFRGSLVPDLARHVLVGVHYVSDAGGTAWLAPALAKAQEEIDGKLPGLVNTLEPAECGCSTKVLVTSASDRQPPVFSLYDTQTKALARIGGSRPGIQAAGMVDTDFTRFKARDGLEIPAWVTKPPGKGPFPTVVLAHGGPSVRGRQWQFSPEAEFLASRGYAVIEPEFRGSAGYGSVLMDAGFRQWGMKIDDDLVDAARWAATSGWSDPKRVCVMGASYGGYAALMALIKNPDTFRCGIAASAVTDIDLMYSLDWNDASNDSPRHGWPLRPGDRVKDAAQLAQTSPILRAAELKQPLLLMHGGTDERVPVEHAEKLRAALLASGKTNLEWVRYDDEAHTLSKPGNRYDFYTRVEKFLDARIGRGSPAI